MCKEGKNVLVGGKAGMWKNLLATSTLWRVTQLKVKLSFCKGKWVKKNKTNLVAIWLDRITNQSVWCARHTALLWRQVTCFPTRSTTDKSCNPPWREMLHLESTASRKRSVRRSVLSQIIKYRLFCFVYLRHGLLCMTDTSCLISISEHIDVSYFGVRTKMCSKTFVASRLE